MAGGQWEVVGSGKPKKNKAKNGGKPKKDDKANGAAVNFAVAGPITESKTLFAALNEKDKKDPPPSKAPKPSETPKSKEKNTHKKKADKKSTTSKPSLEQLFASITEEDVKNHLATLKVLLPNSPLLWLKDLVTFFNVKIDLSIEASAITSKPPGYLTSLLKKSVYTLFLKTINRCSTQTQQVFHEHCLNGLVQDGLKGLHILGYCLFLQFFAQEKPSIAFSNISKCAELCNAHTNRQNICLLIWWAAGQVGNKDLETGFQIWQQLMFPMIGEKNCSSYAIEYLEELINKAKNSEIKKNIIQAKDFFPVFDFIHSKDVPKGVHKRLLAVFPVYKMLSYGCDPENIMRNYFPSFLRRLEPQCPQPLKTEILSNLTYCLSKDKLCFSSWRQLYTKHFIQSKLLIGNLNDEWENLPSNFPQRALYDTLSAFLVTNEEHKEKVKKCTDVEECILIIKELLLKMKANRFSWLRVVVLFVLLSSLFLIVDTMMHESFLESNFGKLMQSAGLSTVCTQAGEKFLYYYEKIRKLLATYIPPLYNWCLTTIGPYVELFLEGLTALIFNIWNNTAPFRAWCNKNLPLLMEQVENQLPGLKESIHAVVRNISVLFVSYATVAWDAIENIIISLQSNDNVIYLLEMTRQHSSTLLSSVQKYSASLLQYAQSYIQ